MLNPTHAGPAASTRGRTALGDISNVRKGFGLADGKGAKVRRPPAWLPDLRAAARCAACARSKLTDAPPLARRA